MSYLIYTPKRGLEKDRMNVLPQYGLFLYTLDERKLYIGDGKTKGGLLIGDIPKEVTLFDENFKEPEYRYKKDPVLGKIKSWFGRENDY